MKIMLMIDNSEVQKQIDKFEELARKFPGYTAYFQGGADRLKDMRKKAIPFSNDDISLLLAGGRTDELMEKLKRCGEQ